MTLGRASGQGDMLDQVTAFCESPLAGTVYGMLARERERIFPDELFADLFTGQGRRSVPPSIVATVMVLQRLEGLSDREAVDRFAFDLRWKHACGVSHDHPPFVHTVLVYFRQRLRKSDDPDRIFRVSREIAAAAGLIGIKRALDSTPLFDAVATQDTVTLIRGAIRGVLRVAGPLESELRAQLVRDDDYSAPGKPVCDWDDPAQRELMIDELVTDGLQVLIVLDEHELPDDLARAAELLATVIGQDIDLGDDGIFRIWRGTAKDRVISTVDPDARHGHKSSKSGYDGYKAHIAIDPDSEIITSACVGAANAGDGAMVLALLDDVISGVDAGAHTDADSRGAAGQAAGTVYGDSAYSSGSTLAFYDEHNLDARTKIQPPRSSGGRFTKNDFTIDLTAREVTCPSGITAPLTGDPHAERIARFGAACKDCPLISACTTSASGRSIRVGPHEQLLTTARLAQQGPEWQTDYRATRPKIERKIAHLVRRLHGGRRARVRGTTRVDQDFKLKAAATNLQRLATLGLTYTNGRWRTQTA